MKNNIELVVFDMAGTTIRDNHEVEKCFAEAAKQVGLKVTDKEILAAQGWSKRFVFETFWSNQMGAGHPELEAQVDSSYEVFKDILESYYIANPVVPTEGCLEAFAYLRDQGIKIALTTGFYRKVALIILYKLGWTKGLDNDFISMGNSAIIDMSITSDEVKNGRPHPDMIQKAMAQFGITNPERVINIGDTPSDLESGKRAGCYLSLGVSNGTHSLQALSACPNDGILSSLKSLPGLLETAMTAKTPTT